MTNDEMIVNSGRIRFVVIKSQVRSSAIVVILAAVTVMVGYFRMGR